MSPTMIPPKGLTDISRWRLHDSCKRPCDTNGMLSRSEEDLVCFDGAWEAAVELGTEYGVAIEFGGGFFLCGIDLDDCYYNHRLEDWAREIVLKFGSYAEVSPSGTGVKIYFLDERAGHYDQPWARLGRLEAYIGGTRYFCVTGHALRGLREVKYAPEAVDWLFSRYKAPKPKYTPNPAPQGPSALAGQDYQHLVHRAEKYVQAIPGAEEGSRDHQLWRVAVVGWRMGLENSEIRRLMADYNDRCQPPEYPIDFRIEHKIEQLSKTKFSHGDLAQYDKLTGDQVHTIIERDEKQFHFVRESELFTGLKEKLKGGHFDLEHTGVDSLDDSLGGGMPKHGLVAIVGRPSHGKTALLMHCMRKRAEQGDKCLFISKEMSIDELLVRKISQVESSPRSEWPHRADSIIDGLSESGGSSNICISDDCVDLEDIVSAIRHMTAVEQVNVVAVDYLQRIPVKGFDDDFQRVTRASLTLANLARELGITMYLACQMNRAHETSDKKRGPLMSDIRASGQIEQDMDLILHVEWPALYGDGWREGLYRINILKSRFMRPSKPTIEIEWDCRKQEFEI